MTNKSFIVKNGIEIGNFVANTTVITQGADIFISAPDKNIKITNSVSNVVITAAEIDIGNTTSNTAITYNRVYIGNSTANVVANSSSLAVGSGFLANSTLVNAAAINIVGQTNTATLFATTTANVGGNVQITTSAINLGASGGTATPSISVANTSGNTQINSLLVSVANSGGTANMSSLGFFVGTVVQNSTTLAVGSGFTANAILVNTAALNVVNQINTATAYVATSVNVGSGPWMNSSGYYGPTSFTANSVGVNAAAFMTTGATNTGTLHVTTSANVGAAVQANTSAIKVVNTIISNTQVIVGNSTVFANLTLSGLSISNGSQTAVLSVPSSTAWGSTNYFLHANGTWTQVPGNPPAGADTYVQYNDGGSTYGGSAGFTFDDVNLNVNISNTIFANIHSGNTAVLNTTLTVGTGTSNAVVNTVGIKVSNSTTNTMLVVPTSAQWSSTNYFLHANGEWAVVPGTPLGGSNTYVQFNDSGTLGGVAAFAFNKSTNTLTATNITAVTSLVLGSNLTVNTTGLYHTGIVNGGSFGPITTTTINATSTVNALSYSVGTTFTANSTWVNAATYAVGTTFTANSILVNAAAINVVNQLNVATMYATTTVNVGSGPVINSTAFKIGSTVANSTHVSATNISGNGSALTSVEWLGASYTVSTSTPSGGNDGDFWFERVA